MFAGTFAEGGRCGHCRGGAERRGVEARRPKRGIASAERSGARGAHAWLLRAAWRQASAVRHHCRSAEAEAHSDGTWSNDERGHSATPARAAEAAKRSWSKRVSAGGVGRKESA